MFKSFIKGVLVLVTILSFQAMTSRTAQALIAKDETQKPIPTSEYRTIYRYWNTKYHYFTTNPNENAIREGKWQSEGEMGRVLKQLPNYIQEDRTIEELYVYHHKVTGNKRFVNEGYKADFEKYEGKDWSYRGRVGFISNVKTALFSFKVYEYQNTDDFLYTGREDEIKKLGNGNYGWENRTLIGYFIAPSAIGGTPTAPNPTPTPEIPEQEKCSAVCIYRYWNEKQGLHYYFTEFMTLVSRKGEYRFEGVLAEIDGVDMKLKALNTKPLYQYRNNTVGNYRFTTKKLDLEGWTFTKQIGYINRTKSGAYQVPIYEYVNNNDYFYTNNYEELKEGAHGWVKTKLIGFAKPH